MKNSNLKIEINLKPTEKNFNSPGMIAYHFIDLNMIESTNFYKLFFGNKEAEDVVYRGIWDVAYGDIGLWHMHRWIYLVSTRCLSVVPNHTFSL